MTRPVLTAAVIAAFAAGGAQSQHRELGAHEHGNGALNIAFEDATILMELIAPGADIVGFEHPAKTSSDRARVDAAIARLADPLSLLTLPEDAECSVTAATVALVGDDAHDGDPHADEAHDHDANDDEAGHTEFHAEYTLTCADIAAIDIILFPYFDHFPNAAELDIQMISDKGAKGFEVERNTPQLNLSGAI